MDNLYCKYMHSTIQNNIICNRNVFTNFLPCFHTINPNNETCLVTCAVSLTCATWLMMHNFSFDPPLYQDTIYFTMKHISFGPHLIQLIMVSGRQWSVPSSSIVVSTHDLYILYNVHCVVQEICTYCTMYTVLYRRSVHIAQCILCCT